MTIAFVVRVDEFPARVSCFGLGHRIKMQWAVGREKPQSKGIASASSVGVKSMCLRVLQ